MSISEISFSQVMAECSGENRRRTYLLTRRYWASLEEKPFLDMDSIESALKKGEAGIPLGNPRFE